MAVDPPSSTDLKDAPRGQAVTVKQQQVEKYGKGKSKYAARFRQLHPDVAFTRNVATFKLIPNWAYEDGKFENHPKSDGTAVYVTLVSDHQLTEVEAAERTAKHGTAKGHSEQVVLSLLQAGYKGVSLKTHWVKWIYTERSMCGPYARNVRPHGHGDSCLEAISLLNADQLKNKGPPISIYYSVPQGEGSALELGRLHEALRHPVWLARHAGLDTVYEVDLRRDVKMAQDLKASHELRLAKSMKERLSPDDYIQALIERLKDCQALMAQEKSLSDAWFDYWQEAEELSQMLEALRR